MANLTDFFLFFIFGGVEFSANSTFEHGQQGKLNIPRNLFKTKIEKRNVNMEITAMLSIYENEHVSVGSQKYFEEKNRCKGRPVPRSFRGGFGARK
jgi:hypothetical protein